MRKVCLVPLFLIFGTQLSTAQVAIQPNIYPYEEKLTTFETFVFQKHVFDYLCEQCKMPPKEIITEVFIESITLGIPNSRALEEILSIFHLNVTAQVGYRTIEQLSLSLEKEWDQIATKRSKGE